jgi:hypothetical protein
MGFITANMSAVKPHPIRLELFVTLKHAPIPVMVQLEHPGRPWVIVGWTECENVLVRKSG